MLPNAVLVRNELAQKVRKLTDLKGRSIGVPLGSATSKTYLQVIMELWLHAWGVSSDKVRWVSVGMNLDGMHGALASGSVDAVFCEEPLASTLVRKRMPHALDGNEPPGPDIHADQARHGSNSIGSRGR